MIPSLIALAALALSASASLADSAPGQPLDLRLTPHQLDVAELEAAGVALLSAHVMRSRSDRFGGVSGLQLAGDRAWMLTDRGVWIEARLARDRDGAIRAVAKARFGLLKDDAGAPLSGRSVDAEALAIAPGGGFWAAFEQPHRIQRFDDLDRPAVASVAFPEARGLRRNGGVEALAIAPDGALIAIAEDPLEGEGPEIRGWRMIDGARTPFMIDRLDDFAPTDAAFAPNGDLYLLERFFTRLLGVRMRVRVFPAAEMAALASPGKGVRVLGPGRTLFTLPGRAGVDNMEGLAVEARADGRVVLTVVSDDNFNLLQQNILLQFLLDPSD